MLRIKEIRTFEVFLDYNLYQEMLKEFNISKFRYFNKRIDIHETFLLLSEEEMHELYEIIELYLETRETGYNFASDFAQGIAELLEEFNDILFNNKRGGGCCDCQSGIH